MKKGILTGIVLLVIVLIGYLFFSQKTLKTRNEIKIGVILPLSGPVASFGKWAQNGMNLAIQETNKDAVDKKMKLIFEDSKFDGKTGLMAYHKLISTNNVDAIISAMSSVSIPILEEKNRKIPVFLQDVTYPNITAKYNNVIRHFIQSDKEASVLSKFATDSLKLRTTGILYVNDEAGNGAKNAFSKLFAKKGEILITESFNSRTKDVKTQVTRIISKKPDCIFLFGNGPTWALALKTIKELNYKGVILTNTALFIPVFRKIAGEATEGVYFTYPYIDPTKGSSKHFIELYKSEYNKNPPLEAAYGYDLVKIISKTKFINDSIILPDSFDGAFGNLTIPKNKDIITKIALALYVNGKINNLFIK